MRCANQIQTNSWLLPLSLCLLCFSKQIALFVRVFFIKNKWIVIEFNAKRLIITQTYQQLFTKCTPNSNILMFDYISLKHWPNNQTAWKQSLRCGNCSRPFKVMRAKKLSESIPQYILFYYCLGVTRSKSNDYYYWCRWRKLFQINRWSLYLYTRLVGTVNNIEVFFSETFRQHLGLVELDTEHQHLVIKGYCLRELALYRWIYKLAIVCFQGLKVIISRVWYFLNKI